MKKTFDVTGINGSFSGSVVVHLNYKTGHKLVHNPSSHDDETRTFPVHSVSGFVGENRMFNQDFTDESLIWAIIEDFELRVRDELHRLATQPRKKTLEDMLRDKGYM